MSPENLADIQNIAQSLEIAARQNPHQVAVAQPVRRRQKRPLDYRVVRFDELNQTATRIAHRLRDHGVQPGMRISLMIPPGIDFVAWVFGVMRCGATAILIDPGMGRRNLLRCLAETRPEGMAGILPAHLVRTLFRTKLKDCRKNFLVGRGFWPGVVVDRLHQANKEKDRKTEKDHAVAADFLPDDFSAESPAAIIFTTGSTGPPKGVLYRHRHFIQQTIQIRDHFSIEPGGVDVSGFPLFALFNTGMATTTVFPRMDATRPASVDPLDIADAVNHFQANQSFGSPALWNTVATFAESRDLRLPTIRRVLTAGAPVPAHVLQRVRAMISPEGTVHTPYGATEALPVACIESREVLDQTAAQTAAGAGTCVGQRWPQIQWRVIRISDDPLEEISGCVELPPGEIGELIVSGPVVTDRYVTRTDANRMHKIADGGNFWHRMGDVGYLDQADRFWFCGRKTHRVICRDRTLFTIPCEAIFNQHPQIYRTALVGVGPPGDRTPVVVAEPLPGHWPRDGQAVAAMKNGLLQLGQASPLTSSVRTILLRRKLPTDIRHNSKIFREKLAVWAAGKL